MSSEEVREFLKSINLCEICILRYTNVEYSIIGDKQQSIKCDQLKRSKPNICTACFGILQENSLAEDIIENSELRNYECDSLYSSIQIPIAILIHELSIWIALVQKFPDKFDENTQPNKSIKDVFKYLFNKKVCEATNRRVEFNQNGILVEIFYDYDLEKVIIGKLQAVKPLSMEAMQGGRNRNFTVTRNIFEKHYFPKNLNLDEFQKHLPVPPTSPSVPIKLMKYVINGPTIYVAGRYRKLSRNLSQTPWILNDKRMKEDSIQEIISREICPFFGIDFLKEKEKLNFMGSGREDVDVRCLGRGRPFALQISDAKKSTLPKAHSVEMERCIDNTKQISAQLLQLVKREELVHIKTGEEQKKKIYQALCVLDTPATADIIRKLDIPNGFLVQQQTPLRVLHRRPLLTRPRQIFSVKGKIFKDKTNIIVLNIITQAGAYVKELVHGEFGRTHPSISSVIGQKIDIVALDVKDIDLDWPNEH